VKRDVRLVDNPNDPACVIDNRDSTHLVLRHRRQAFLDTVVVVTRDRICRHDVRNDGLLWPPAFRDGIHDEVPIGDDTDQFLVLFVLYDRQ
jgi:hypothetical protein